VTPLHAALDRIAERRRAEQAAEAFAAALIRGEARICGARVRLEWVDPKPAVVDALFPPAPEGWTPK
jgi:hypothetical protein